MKTSLIRSLGVWSNKVKERDGRCVVCGEVKGLEAHHIVPKSVDSSHQLNINNGITLCEGCHAKAHGLPPETLLRLMMKPEGRKKYSDEEWEKKGGKAYSLRVSGMLWAKIFWVIKEMPGPRAGDVTTTIAVAKRYAEMKGDRKSVV